MIPVEFLEENVKEIEGKYYSYYANNNVIVPVESSLLDEFFVKLMNLSELSDVDFFSIEMMSTIIIDIKALVRFLNKTEKSILDFIELKKFLKLCSVFEELGFDSISFIEESDDEADEEEIEKEKF